MAAGVIRLSKFHVSVCGVKRPFDAAHVGDAARKLRVVDHLAPETYRLGERSPPHPPPSATSTAPQSEGGVGGEAAHAPRSASQVRQGALACSVSPQSLENARMSTATDDGFDGFFKVASDGLAEQLEQQTRALDARPEQFFETFASADAFTDELHYCKRHRLWMHAKKKITGGSLVFVTDQSGRKMVLKNQRIDAPEAVAMLDVAPGAWCTELQALISLRFLMSVKGVAPLFCELLHNETYRDGQRNLLYSSMRLARYDTSLLDWLMCQKCAAKPNINVSADPGDGWTISAGGGRALALSSHASDVRLFNAILRAVIFQVFLGLAAAQRHLRFSHNDLHIGNVMLSSELVSGVKKFVTGFGTFALPNKCPTIRIIDFQHSAFDLVRSDGAFERRVRGYPTAWANERGLLYDTWRFCSHLLLEGLHALLPAVDADLRDFLWSTAQLPGTYATGATLPRIPNERHWTPCLMAGVLPEHAVLDDHGPFRCFRGDTHGLAEHTFVERGDNIFPCPTARFVRTVFVQTAPTERSLARFSERHKPRRKKFGDVDDALVRLLNAFVSNYVKRVDVGMSNMHKFTVSERASYLFRELEFFQTGMHVLWTLPGAEAARLVQAGPVACCAAADAIQCVLRNDLRWTHRAAAPDHVAFFEYVKRTTLENKALQHAAATRTPLALPCHAALAEFLLVNQEHHLQAIKGREAFCVARSVYE